MRLREPIADGSVDLLFRRWRSTQAVAGRRYRTAAGMLLVSAVDEVEPGSITAAQARRAEYRDAASLLADLAATPAPPCSAAGQRRDRARPP